MKGKGGNWTVEDLDHFLQNPKGFVPGTNMSFAGVPRGSERADVIAYPELQVGQPGAAAEGGRSRRAGTEDAVSRVRCALRRLVVATIRADLRCASAT